MEYNADNLAEIKAMGSARLAGLIDCAYPDNDEAKAFLTDIRDSVLEQTDYVAAEDWERELVEDYSGSAHEIADNAPNVYTWRMWQQFVGLSGWQWDDDAADYGSEDTDMNRAASLRLYIIAKRLVRAIAEDIAGNLVDTDDD